MRRCARSCCVVVLLGNLLFAATAARAQATIDDRMLLDGTGIDAALIAKFADGKPLDAAERPALIGVWSGLRQCSQLDLDRYSRPSMVGDGLLKPEGRSRLWQVQGCVKSVVVEELSDEELELVYAEVDDLPAGDARRRVYRCEVAHDCSGPALTVYSLAFPKGIPDRENLNERIRFQGVCVKNEGTAEAPRPLLVTRRLGWYPHTPLGDLGMDYALYDDVRREAHDLKAERECFYQLLATMKRADSAKLTEWTDAKEPQSVVPLFNAPETMQGKLIGLEGIARRAVAVVVNEPDIEERFGIKQYYEVAVYTADSQQNPLLFNLLELPAGFPQGESIRTHVRIPGTFLTGFYYRRDATSDEQVRGVKPPWQKAPLLIGKSLTYFADADVTPSANSAWFAVAIAAAVLVLIAAVWRATRSEAKTRDLLLKQMAPPPGTSLNDAQVEYQAKPDFSGIETPPPADDDASSKS